MSLAEQRVEALYNQLPIFFREPKIVSYKNQYRLYLSEYEMRQDIGFQNHLHSFCSSRTFESVKEDINTDYSYFFNHSHYSGRPKWAENKGYIHLWADSWANQLHYTGSVLGEEDPEVFEKIAYKAFLNLRQLLAIRFPTQAFALYLKLNYATDDETVDFGYEKTPCFDLWFEKYYPLQKLSEKAEGNREDYDLRLECSQEVMRRRLEQKKAGKAVEYGEPIWIRNFVNFTDSDSLITSIPEKYVANAYFLFCKADTPKIVSINTDNSK